MKIRRDRNGEFDLNITPLIDVVFILLVFFLLATNFARYRLIRVDTPQETQVVATAEGAIVIGLKADGGFTFDTAPIETADLPARISEVVAIDPGRTFLIRPEDGVPLQQAIAAYDVTKVAGATVVSFSPPGEATP